MKFRGGNSHKVSSYTCPHSGHCHLLLCGFSWLNDTCHLLPAPFSWFFSLPGFLGYFPTAGHLLLPLSSALGVSLPFFLWQASHFLFSAYLLEMFCSKLLLVSSVSPSSTLSLPITSSGAPLGQSALCRAPSIWTAVLGRGAVEEHHFILYTSWVNCTWPSLHLWRENISYFHYCPLTEHVFKDIQWARE